MEQLSLRERIIAMALVPFIRLLGDVAKMAGYPVGIWWRYSGRGPAKREQQV
jgi:hypothetical protein